MERIVLENMVISQKCGADWYGLIVDGEGRVAWYENLGAGAGMGALSGLTGFAWSEEDSLVIQFDADRVMEIDAAGNTLLDQAGFALPLHHDIAVQGDYIYSLNADDHNGDVVDGFYIIDRATGATTASWAMQDHIAITGGGGFGGFWNAVFPGSSDWSHGNCIHVYPDGTALLSLRHQDAVLEVVSDHQDPSFGDVNWILEGMPGNDIESTLTLDPGDLGFDGQHCASWTSGGQLMLFDNGNTGNSRAVVMDIDPVAETAATAESWYMGEQCNVQGAMYENPTGSYLATCADKGLVMAFESGTAAPVWTLEPSCGGGGGPPALMRAVPVALD